MYRDGVNELIRHVMWIPRDMTRARSRQNAAAIAFWGFLALVPLIAFLGFAASRFLRSTDLSVLSRIDAPKEVRTYLSHEIAHVSAWDGGILALVAGLGLMWSSLSGLHAIVDAFAAVTGRSAKWSELRLRAFLTCCAIAGLSVGAAVLLQFNGVKGFEANPWGAKIVALTATAAFTYVLYAVSVPGRARVRLPRVPGVITVCIANTILARSFGFYLQRVGLNSAYGASLAAVAATLLTLYLFALSLLLGLSVNRFTYRIFRVMRVRKKARIARTATS